MKKNLLKYEFWDEERKFYLKAFSHVLNSDLSGIRTSIAKKAASREITTLRWLDIGTGDGSTLVDIIQKVQRISPEVSLQITAIEPSKFSIPHLRKKFGEIKNAALQVKNKKLMLQDFESGSYDVITFLHSNYYLGLTAEDYKRIYGAAYEALKPGGILMVQSISSSSDFQKLGHPNYSKWSLGEATKKIFYSMSGNYSYKKLPTHFDATYAFSGPEEALHLYRFVTQTHKQSLNKKELAAFYRKIHKLTKEKGGKYILNFWDCINSVTYHAVSSKI